MNLEFIWGIVRHVLTMLGGILVTSGYLDADQVSQVVGAVMVLAMIGFSSFNRLKNQKTLEQKDRETDIALDLPAGSSREQIKKEMNLR